MALLSFTSKEYYKSCGHFYKLKYKDRLHPSIRMNVRPFLEGSAMHNAIEMSYAIKKPLDKDVTVGVFNTAWNKTVTDQRRQGNFIFNKGETLEKLKSKTLGITMQAVTYINFLGIDKTEFYNEYKLGTFDKPYNLAEGLQIHGAADHVQVLSDQIRVYDYKASKNATYLKPAQLILYGIIAEKEFDRPLRETAFLMFQLNKKMNVWPTDENKKRVLDEFIEIAHKIDDGVFKPNPSEQLCGDCVFRNQCEHSSVKQNEGPKIISLGELEL